MRKRTRSRELALQILYQADIRHEDIKSILSDFWKSQSQSSEELEPSIMEFAENLAQGTQENIKQIDTTISSYAQNWQLERMAVIDRNIMRMSCYELLFLDDVPPKVSINEAVDLAKKYGDLESGKFVNGILDKINKKEISK
ncbi:MAG: transcription antitermination factor NusB [Candidatus Orphnella occulta]|nr:transcription antitermination factor NusB [Candidatus Orphnella occulta]